MLLEISDFCRRATTGLPGLVSELREETGRYGQEEEAAWASSLSRAAYVLDRPQLKGFHLHVGQRGNVAIEYRLPASSSWCDLVLLGQNSARPQAVIIELKDWAVAGDESGGSEGLIWHHGQLELHPADQVRGYVEYSQRFHSAVLEFRAGVNGCVYFTRPENVDAYGRPPHDRLVAEYPLFTDDARDRDVRFPEYLAKRLQCPDVDFAKAFERGGYRQDRNFCQQIAEQIAKPGGSPFVLLDHQRKAFEVCRAAISETLDQASEGKMVVIIEGPPGSGKSVVAARLWAWLQQDPRLSDSDCVLTTTSSSQRSNWKRLFERTGRGAAGIVLPANQYAPADAKWVGDYKKTHGKAAMRPEDWVKNVKICRRSAGNIGPAVAPLVSIVDEAHALINPESPNARTPAGWPVAFGPQAWHIIRASRVAVFLMDSSQSFRDRETTTRVDIQKWAKELGARVEPVVSLAGLQFRAAGSAEYTRWVEYVLGLSEEEPIGPNWRLTARNPRGSFVFEIVADPLALEEALLPRISEGDSARLVATYGRRWLARPGLRSKTRQAYARRGETDFDITFRRGRKQVRWRKVWNYVPGGTDYTYFVQAPAGSPMAENPLAEVGCPYVVRGFDYDWIGLLWLRDLVWRKNRWVVNLAEVFESGVAGTLNEARRERGDGPAKKELARRIQQAYRILLTRAIQGIYVWFEDRETEERVRSLLP